MRISIELDGSFWLMPEFFGKISNYLKSEGHEVGILTGHSEEIKKEDLRLLWERVRFVPSFFYCRDNDDFEMNEIEWKAEMINLKSIDLHFDHNASQLKYSVKIPTIMLLQQNPQTMSIYDKKND